MQRFETRFPGLNSPPVAEVVSHCKGMQPDLRKPEINYGRVAEVVSHCKGMQPYVMLIQGHVLHVAEVVSWLCAAQRSVREASPKPSPLCGCVRAHNFVHAQ